MGSAVQTGELDRDGSCRSGIGGDGTELKHGGSSSHRSRWCLSRAMRHPMPCPPPGVSAFGPLWMGPVHCGPFGARVSRSCRRLHRETGCRGACVHLPLMRWRIHVHHRQRPDAPAQMPRFRERARDDDFRARFPKRLRLAAKERNRRSHGGATVAPPSILTWPAEKPTPATLAPGRSQRTRLKNMIAPQRGPVDPRPSLRRFGGTGRSSRGPRAHLPRRAAPPGRRRPTREDRPVAVDPYESASMVPAVTRKIPPSPFRPCQQPASRRWTK